MIDYCEPKVVAHLDDIQLPDGYKLSNLIVQEYDRGDYIDKSIKGSLTTPAGYPTRYKGEPLCVMYDIDMKFRNAHNKLTFIDYHWYLPASVWQLVENALTIAAEQIT